jgi:hypothetical protein
MMETSTECKKEAFYVADEIVHGYLDPASKI